MIEKVLTLSTAHVPGENPNFGALRYCEHEYGWVVFLGSEDQPVPVWLRDIVWYAQKNDCFAVHFDADGPIEKSLRTYQW